MTIEALIFEVVTLPHFVIVIAKGAAANADAQARLRCEQVGKSNLGVEINRSGGEPKRYVRAQELGVVVVIVRVERLGALARHGLVVAELKQAAGIRINLCQTHEAVPRDRPIATRSDFPELVFRALDP
jgi:hypothetical protein